MRRRTSRLVSQLIKKGARQLVFFVMFYLWVFSVFDGILFGRGLHDLFTDVTKYRDMSPYDQNFIRIHEDDMVTCENSWNELTSRMFLQPQKKSTSNTLVLTFCKHQLEWLHDYCVGTSFRAMTIYSKCGHDDIALAFISSQSCAMNVSLVRLPNVGGVDHAIAFHISNLPSTTDPREIILFVKDTFLEVHQRRSTIRSFEDIIRLAVAPLGFGCGLKPTLPPRPRFYSEKFKRTFLCVKHILKKLFSKSEADKDGLCYSHDEKISVWHKTNILMSFHMATYSRGRENDRDESFKSTLSFSRLLQDLNVSLPAPLTPVCYGGSFAAKVSHILRVKEPVTKLMKYLSRGDNIIEGHYAERMWAGLLSSRIPLEAQSKLLSLSKTTFPHMDMKGALFGCKSHS